MRKVITHIAMLVLLCGCSSSGNPDKNAQQFIQMLKEGKHLAVQECLSKDMIQMATLMGGVTDQSLKPYYRSGQIIEFTLTPMEKTENAVRYKVSVICTDGKTYQDVLDLKREDGKWHVSRF